MSPEPVHSTLGWVGMFFGVSAKTIRVNYRCRRCEQVFDETTDPSVLRLVY